LKVSEYSYLRVGKAFSIGVFIGISNFGNSFGIILAFSGINFFFFFLQHFWTMQLPIYADITQHIKKTIIANPLKVLVSYQS